MAVMPGGGDHAEQGMVVAVPADAATAVPTRRERLRIAAAARGVPLAAIITTVAVVALAYLAGKLIYRMRDVILLIVVAGFIALILNPAGGVPAAVADPAARLGCGRGDHLGGAGVRRPGGGVRLSAGARADPPVAAAAR